ncbi:MAG TPA: 30S ribosomal protein S16 [Pelolinea sp.]|nr:30S ribosomal protein S16 [Pelolinea sp.]
MVRIRLRRVGLRNQPSYRIVAADKEKPRDGRFLEILGFYNPRTEPSTVEVKEDRIYHWLKLGAQPSDSVMQIFKEVGLLDRFEKFKEGESVEKLLAESKTFFESRVVNPKTQRIAKKKE